jgi:hypothetical protein
MQKSGRANLCPAMSKKKRPSNTAFNNINMLKVARIFQKGQLPFA